nr:FAD-dependent oxidoreductase [Neobacillus sp. Marseille-Q6967]
MSMKLEKLASPFQLKSKTLKNRIVVTAHALGWDEDGVITDKYADYFIRRAKGGAGLVMCFGAANVHKGAGTIHGSISLWDERNEPVLKRMAKEVHENGAYIISQASHLGRRGDSRNSFRPLMAPSDIPEPSHREIPHVLDKDEIQSIIFSFAEAAKRLEKCGWDGIEITSFGDHLIEQFWNPKINNRTDEYGESFENRMRFSLEVIDAVANAVSDDFIIGFRLTSDQNSDTTGLHREDLLNIAKRLEATGKIDLFNISGGTGITIETQAGTVPGDTYARGTYLPLIKKYKTELSTPILGACRVLDVQLAEETLNNGTCDLVAMTRAMMADPDLPKKAFQGKTEEIRPCIACNEGCIGRMYQGTRALCTVNPAMMHPEFEKVAASINKLKVVIVGGGPTGLEAARIAAERGHEVVLFEERSGLGGQVFLAGKLPARPHIGLHIDWLKKELTRLKVTTYLGEKVTVDRILQEKPDEVVIATGSKSAIPFDVPHSTAILATDVDLLQGNVTITEKSNVLVYDIEGHHRGGGIANYIAEQTKSSVELVTPFLQVSDTLDPTQLPAMMRRLARNEVICTPNQEIDLDEKANLLLKGVWSDEIRKVENFDYIIFVGYRKANTDLYDVLKASVLKDKLHLAGDALAPRRYFDAVTEGVRIGNQIGNKVAVLVNE